MITNPEDKRKFQNAIQEISNSMTRTEAERDLINEVIKNLSEDFDMNKKIIRKIARAYHKQNLAEEQNDHEEFVEVYEEVISAKN
jgi:FixJ family two-component response regulator